MRNGKLGAGEDLLEEQVHRLVVAIEIKLLDRGRRAAMAGIVPDHVERAEGFRRFGHDRFKLCEIGHVAVHKAQLVLAEARLEGAPLLVLDVARDDLCARRDEDLDARETNAARSACDDCHFALEICHVLLPLCRDMRWPSARGVKALPLSSPASRSVQRRHFFFKPNLEMKIPSSTRFGRRVAIVKLVSLSGTGA